MSDERPYSFASRRFSRALALNCSLFFYLFLVFFQPFGVNNYRPHSFLSLELILGILPLIPVVYFTIFLSEDYLRAFLSERFELKPMAWYSLEFFIVGSLSFLLYNILGDFHDFKLKSYVFHLLEVSSILIFPFGSTIYYFRFKHLQSNYKRILTNSTGQSKLDDLLHLTGDYKKDQIALRPKEIIHLSSEDNYVELKYLQENEVKKYLIRSTLSGIQKSLDPNFFIRCHRSHLINITQVDSYRKEKNRLWIKLKGIENEIPVSRNFQDKLLEQLAGSSEK